MDSRGERLRKNKLKVSKVQVLFNQAIIRRDERCIIYGNNHHLQCSHFYAIGGNSCLRFYPHNAHAMSAKAHIDHHNRDPLMYAEWMQTYKPEELAWMKSVRGKTIRYNQAVLADIAYYCTADLLDELAEYIEGLLGGRQ